MGYARDTEQRTYLVLITRLLFLLITVALFLVLVFALILLLLLVLILFLLLLALFLLILFLHSRDFFLHFLLFPGFNRRLVNDRRAKALLFEVTRTDIKEVLP